MTVKALRTDGFRNLLDGVFTPGDGVNVLYGDNAQGKTNLVEAIWLCTGSRSFRGARDADMVRLGGRRSALEMVFEAAGREQQIRLTLENGRRAELNGIPLESPSRLAGEFCAVIFSPEHLGLVKDGPSLRRRFLDGAICQLMPKYVAAAGEYRRILTQRNALLKDIPGHSELLDTLEVWDDRLSRAGALLVFTRLRYLRRLEKAAAGFYSGITAGKESLSLRYDGPEYDGGLDDTSGALRAISSTLLRELAECRAADLECGYTRTGPHRDDLDVRVNELSARVFGSQGQQRSAVLALKLGEAAVLREKTGEAPVLLLDDVLSELDRGRQDYLLNHIEGQQVFITCCDPEGLHGFAGGRAFAIAAGRVAESARLTTGKGE